MCIAYLLSWYVIFNLHLTNGSLSYELETVYLGNVVISHCLTSAFPLDLVHLSSTETTSLKYLSSWMFVLLWQKLFFCSLFVVFKKPRLKNNEKTMNKLWKNHDVPENHKKTIFAKMVQTFSCWVQEDRQKHSLLSLVQSLIFCLTKTATNCIRCVYVSKNVAPHTKITYIIVLLKMKVLKHW